MRKIFTREEIIKREKRNKVLIGILLVGIMIASSAGYAFYQTGRQEKKLDYNGINFVLEDNGLWHGKIQEYELFTAYNPKETENISFFINLNLWSYKNKVLYFPHDSYRLGIEEIVRNFNRVVERVQYVCLEECEEDMPIKECTDNIIVIKQFNETLIKQEDKCIYIFAKDDEILMAVDAFIFRIFGVQ